jgi:hypothetical protein
MHYDCARKNRFIGQLTGVSMFKMILKKALIFSLPVLSMNAHSSDANKEFLANQCYELSQVVISLADGQEKMSCIDKLYMASVQMNTAAFLIREESSNSAKQILNNAVSALQYAELLSCNQYILISHSKFEAQKIKSLL